MHSESINSSNFPSYRLLNSIFCACTLTNLGIHKTICHRKRAMISTRGERVCVLGKKMSRCCLMKRGALLLVQVLVAVVVLVL